MYVMDFGLLHTIGFGDFAQDGPLMIYFPVD